MQKPSVPASLPGPSGVAQASTITLAGLAVPGAVQIWGMHRLRSPASEFLPHSSSVRHVWNVPIGYMADVPGHESAVAAVQNVDPWRPMPMIVWQQMPPLQSAASLHAITEVLQPVFGELHVSVEPPLLELLFPLLLPIPPLLLPLPIWPESGVVFELLLLLQWASAKGASAATGSSQAR